MMRFGSVCSGIESASVAWNGLGWRAAWFSEIDPFACRVLSHHYPRIPNYGDANLFGGWPHESVDLIAGGTPCQSFSLAGLRKGIDDPRGNVMLAFVGIVERFRPRWVIWENVPGVLSSNGGRDFGAFLGALEKLGYGWAYRTLDAQFFGVPQRRRRVFVVGCFADQSSAAAVLFERESVRGLPAKKRGENGSDACVGDEVRCLECGVRWQPDGGLECCPMCGALQSWAAITCGTLSDGAHMGGGLNGQDANSGRLLVHAGLPRRLTPLECERLQGFPSGYTDIPSAKDGPRFRALGNAWAVPVARWIGDRIATVNSRMLSA